MSSTNGYLDRDAIAASMTTPVVDYDAPELGGTIRVRAIPSANAEYIKFVEGTSPSPAAIAQGIRQLPLNQDQMIELYERQVAKQDYPTETEVLLRTAVAAIVLCVLDGNDQPMYTWDDVDEIRGWNRTLLTEIGALAHQLARPETLEEAKKDSGSDQTSEPSTASASTT